MYYNRFRRCKNEKLILVDGNNLMFRSYHATLYSGRLMKNSKGVVTNALYVFYYNDK